MDDGDFLDYSFEEKGSFKDIQRSNLHKVVARTTLVPVVASNNPPSYLALSLILNKWDPYSKIKKID